MHCKQQFFVVLAQCYASVKTGTYFYSFLTNQWNFCIYQNTGLFFMSYTTALQRADGIQLANYTTK